MRAFLALFLLLAAGPSAFAASLADYSVFSRTSILGARSDFQGRTGALGAVRLENFLIKGDLESASSVSLSNGTIAGAVRAPSVSLVRATSRGRSVGAKHVPELADVNFQIDGLVLNLATLAANASALVVADGLSVQTIGAYTIVDINGADFAAASSLHFSGEGELLVRVHGREIDFVNKGVFLAGGLQPSQVAFFFPETTKLRLAQSGGPGLGIPGSVIAPLAVVDFYDVLVTGQLIVGRLCNTSNLPTGQVNLALSWWVKQYLPAACGC
jgi:choice-of-anchor A domain-containing protein